MGILLSANQISKHVGDKSLFEDLSFGLFEREKTGLIGPNGSGKSSLLKILAQKEVPDSGEVVCKKNLSLYYIPQKDEHPQNKSVLSYCTEQVQGFSGVSFHDAEVLASTSLNLSGFEDNSLKISSLSGGWLKRLSIAIGLACEPELLILDEPTNHMDWEGILWLEKLLKNFKQSFLLVSHDRSLLQNCTNRTIELNQAFKEGYLSYKLSYLEYLEKKREHLDAMESLQSSMSNKARRETAWLKAGVKARTTKSQSRMNEAHELIEELSNLSNKTKSARSKVNLEIDSTERKTKKLIELKNLSVGYPNLTLVKNLTMNLGPKKCVGLLGHNGSGKTTFLKTLIKEINPLGGSVRHADDLKIVYFEQKRSELPKKDSLVSYLGDGSDYVVFKDQSVHVASYASRFMFASDRLNMPIHKLSGGEQARLLLAKVFLKPSDVLILDEPTNDLDIETIDVLEGLIENFGGLVLLVSHDRSFLKSVCTDYLAFDGSGSATPFADLEQWLSQSLQGDKSSKNNKRNEASSNQKQTLKPKLSYNDKKFLENAEDIILEEEDVLLTLNSTLEKVVSTGEGEEIQKISIEISEQQKKIDELYAKWDDLNQKLELIKGV